MDRLLAKIRIAYRPLLILAALALPLAGLFYYMMSGFAHDIRITEMELKGARYQRSLQQLLKLVPEHKRASRAAAVSAEIDKAFDSLVEVDHAIGADLLFIDVELQRRGRETASITRLRQAWNGIKARGVAPVDADEDDPHDILVTNIRSAITHVGDTSNLILDSELDSFYLIDATLGALPDVQDRLGRVIDFAAQEGTLTPAKQAQLLVFATQLRDQGLDRVTGSIQTSLNETAKLRGSDTAMRAVLTDPLKLYVATATQYLPLLEKQQKSSSMVAKADEFIQKGDAMRAASFALWEVSMTELERLLQSRKHQLDTRRLDACLIISMCLATAVLIFWAVVRSITVPLSQISKAAITLAGGDLTVNLPHAKRPDEVGDVARSMEHVRANLGKLLNDVNRGVMALGAASSELSEVSSRMAANSHETSSKSQSVAAAAEEMSANSVSVASGMEQASTNLTTVAAATEEMTSTIGEIARNSERAREITSQANAQADRVKQLMQNLTAAANAIGKVTETIANISSQTNLLALNATIEAARAGAAGKGFAVVAHEIKELARQTADATEDIKSKVEGIQASTLGTLDDLGQISDVIGQVSEVVGTIASAIEEQSSVTRDIAQNVGEAAHGVKEGNQRVAEISTASQSVARDVATVNIAANDMTTGAAQVLAASGELSKLAAALKIQMAQFKVGV